MTRAVRQAGDSQPRGVSGGGEDPALAEPEVARADGRRPGPDQDGPLAALAQLQAGWPGWQIWTVHRYIGGTVWCARRRDDHRKVLNADSAEHLTEYLTEAVSQ